MPSKNNLDGSGPFEADSSQVLKFQFFLCWNMVFGWKTRNIKWYYWWFKNPANSPVDMVNIPFFTTGFMHPNGGLPSPDSPWCQVERPCELGFSLGFRWEPRQPPPFQHDMTHVICHFFLPVMFSSTGISVYLFLKIDMFIYYFFFCMLIYSMIYIYIPFHNGNSQCICSSWPRSLKIRQISTWCKMVPHQSSFTHMSRIAWFRPSEALGAPPEAKGTGHRWGKISPTEVSEKWSFEGCVAKNIPAESISHWKTWQNTHRRWIGWVMTSSGHQWTMPTV